MKVTLVRHTAVDVPPGTCYGQSDVDVLPTFADEARLVRGRLCGGHYDRVYSSPLKRCVKLAHACGYGTPVMDHRLKELNFGQWEMQRWDEITDPRLQEYYADYVHVAPTGGENFEQQCQRVRACLHDISQQAGQEASVLIFTHGGVIAAAMIHALGIEATDAFARQPRYGEVVTLDM